MKHVMPARTQLKVRTVFNILGPLANPALPRFQVWACLRRKSWRLVAAGPVGLEDGTASSCTATDGLDEISISAQRRSSKSRDADIAAFDDHSGRFRSRSRQRMEALRGGDARTNASDYRKYPQGRDEDRDVMLS